VSSRGDRGGQRLGMARGGFVIGGLRVGAEVASALVDGRGVVGLETSVIGQGLPHPRNLECIDRMAEAIRVPGAVPAWVGVRAGEVVVGLSEDELTQFAEPGRADKVARRDLPAACPRAGIRVSATGGIGGVHPGERWDVSADLVELSRTPGLLVSSGPKSIVNPEATAERLEELGVTLVGYGVDRLPFFLAREAPVTVAHRVDTPEEAAAILGAAIALDTRSTVVVCNPIPHELAMDADEVAAAARRCEERAEHQGVRGRDLTPFLLSCLAEATEGRSLEANLALLESNAALAGAISSVSASSAPDPDGPSGARSG
jgi:pseudouridine-5'-phosphate glycosidase